MSKVMHKPNFKSSHLSKHFNSLLHRGQKSKDPYNNKRLSLSSVGLLLKTLGTGSLSTRCSSTFNSDSKFNNYINNSKNLRIAGFSAAFILLILSALTIYPIVKNLNTVEAAEAKNSTTSLSITSTNSASVELLVQSSSGTFATSSTSQKLNFGVTTDNYAGYKLTLLGKDSSYANLKNSSTNANLTSIDSSKASSAFSNGYWGYTLDDDNTYLPAPNNTTGYTIDTTSSPNASTAKTYTLGVGAKADYSTKAGTYTNTYVLTAVGNGTPYVIYYKDNTNDSSVANLPNTQDESTTAINVNLSSTVPTRTGYTFSKWCDGTVSNDGTTCSGTLYSASASFGIDRTKPVANNTTTLYAVWTPKSYTLNITNNNTTSNPASSTTINFKGSTNITVTPNSGYYLSAVSCPSGYTCSGYSTGKDKTSAQTITITNNSTDAGGTIEFTATKLLDNVGELQSLTDSQCTTTPVAATDNRDSQEYVIQRLADGNCWMMTNLNLGATTLTTDLTSSNTNLSSTVTASTFNGWKKSAGSNTYTAGEYIPVSGNDTTNGLPYGTLYNYCVTSAGTICVDSNPSDANYDICPKGWRLPVGGGGGVSSNEFYNLYKQSAYNSNTGMRKSYIEGGAAFALAGRFSNAAPIESGSNGYYWSSKNTGTVTMHDLAISTTSINVGNTLNRYLGFSVRCIKNPDAKSLYDTVAAMSKGTQTAADLQAAITIPTSANYKEDTSNSGVYEYNASVFGTASDASNDYKIYYYRGVLENETASYGSNGSAVTYPNYVRLGSADSSSTCWRIVRTTGSGGIKMIYNGLWDSTNSTCANGGTLSTNIGTSSFNGTTATHQQVVRAGYTYNDSYATNSNTSRQAGAFFGTNSDFSKNTTDSTMKISLDAWYDGKLKNAYNSHLEASAGYCAERTLYNPSNNAILQENTTIAQYSTDTTAYNFGATTRNMTTALKPSLTCATYAKVDRSIVDLYTASSALNGNKQLKYPIALLTADEASFAGSGSSNAANGSSYHVNSYLRSNSYFRLLSPYNRGQYGYVTAFVLSDSGYLSNDGVGYGHEVRPVISLSPDAIISSGTGIATDPWEVNW